LLDGGGAKRVACGEQSGLPAQLNRVGKLGGGGGFTRAIDANDGNNRRAVWRWVEFGFV